MIFPLGHIAHALHALKDLLGGGDENAAAPSPGARAQQLATLQGRLAAMSSLPAGDRARIVALLQSGDLHAAGQALDNAARAPAPPQRAMPPPAPRRSRAPRRDGLGR